VSLWSAGRLLWWATVKNRIRKTLRRLREPRYLVGAALAVLYLSSFLGRAFVRGSHGTPLPEIPFDVMPYVDAGLFVVAVVVLGASWIFKSQPTLRFTESEIQLLFPAPLSRRDVLNYKLTTGLIRVAGGALISTLFIARNGLLNPLQLWLAAVLAFGTVWLHLVGIGLTKSSLREHGKAGWRLQAGTLAVLLVVVALLARAALQKLPPIPHPLEPGSFTEWMGTLLTTRPLAWLLVPVKAIVRVAVAKDPASFGQWLVVALGVLGVHYLWVVRQDAAFEEAALRSAEERAQTKAARASGRRGPKVGAKLRRAWLPLGATGRPELAIAWKNTIACQRLYALPLFIFAVAFAVPVGSVVFAVLGERSHSDLLFAAGAVCGALSLILSLSAPMMLRADLRQEVKQLDILRALPLRGWQVVAAELLGPALLLALLQASLVAAALVLSAAGHSTIAWRWRLSAAVAALVVGPLLGAAMLLVQNLAVVLFPAWVSTEPGQRGLEAMGQRLLSMLGTLLVMAVGLLPSGIAGGLVGMALTWAGLPALALAVGAVAGAVVLAAELVLGVHLAGRAFDSLDPSIG
jgi:hypothetical protein